MTEPDRPQRGDEDLVVPAPWVSQTVGPHGTVLADLRRGGPVDLSGTADLIWRAVGAGRRVGDVVGDVVRAHPSEVPELVAEQTRAFLDELVAAGYLVDGRRSGDGRLGRRGDVPRAGGNEAPLEGDAQGG